MSADSRRADCTAKRGLQDADIGKLQRYCSDLPPPTEFEIESACRSLFCFKGFGRSRSSGWMSGISTCGTRPHWSAAKGRDDKEPIHLHPSTVRVLREYLNWYRFRSGALFRSDSNHCRGERLTTKSVREIIKRVFAKLEIDGSTHGFRHFFYYQVNQNPIKGNYWWCRNTVVTGVFRCSKFTTTRLFVSRIYPGFTKSLTKYGYEEATTPEYLLFGGELENEPAVQTKRASDARHIAGCRGDKIHLPQVQHTERVLRIPAAIHVRALPELYDFIHCLSWQTE